MEHRHVMFNMEVDKNCFEQHVEVAIVEITTFLKAKKIIRTAKAVTSTKEQDEKAIALGGELIRSFNVKDVEEAV